MNEVLILIFSFKVNYEFLYIFACEVSRLKKSSEVPIPKKRVGKEVKNINDGDNNKED